MVQWAFGIFVCVIVIGGIGAGIAIGVQRSIDKKGADETTEEKLNFNLLKELFFEH